MGRFLENGFGEMKGLIVMLLGVRDKNYKSHTKCSLRHNVCGANCE